MKYAQIQGLEEDKFRRLTGVKGERNIPGATLK